MADWNGLVAHIRNTYKISDEGDGYVNMTFKFDDLRSQRVQVANSGDFLGSVWADIRTIVGDASAMSPDDALTWNMDHKIGFLAKTDGHLWLVHRFPLKDLDADEFNVPLQAIVAIGDNLEKELTGKDEH